MKTIYTSNMNDGTDPIALAKQLMAQPTYGESLGVEHAAIHVIAQRFDKLGIPYTLRQHKGRSYNIIAHVNKDRGTPSIVLNTHLDVVPPGNEEAWQHDPFQPVIVQEELIGRGACDAKGSAAAMVIAFEQLWRERHRLSGSVCLALVGGEETGGAGTIYEIDHGLRADAVIVGEPTQLVPHIAHKGRMTVEVSARGQAAHSSEPHLGENAIQRMGVLLPKLAAVHSQVSKKTHALLGSASSAITQIEGGVAVNVIPPHCTVRIDRRLLPGETPEDALQQYKEAISLTNMNGHRPAWADVRLIEAILPAETRDRRFAQFVQNVASETLGYDVPIAGFPATCDMTHWENRGRMSTIIYGPGDLKQAHQVNESIRVADIHAAVRVYYAVCKRWVNASQTDDTVPRSS